MPKSINLRTIGLQKYLDDTASKHNGLGYDMFIKLYAVSRIGPLNLSRAFQVSKNTMYKWISVYEEAAVLNEKAADAIVLSTIKKQKGQN